MSGKAPKPGAAKPAPKPASKQQPPPAPPLELTREERQWYAQKLALAMLANEAREAAGLDPIALLPPTQVRLERKKLLDAARAKPDTGPPPEPPTFEAQELGLFDEKPAKVRSKLKLWRLRARVDVELNAQDGDVMAWRDAALAQERGEKKISSHDASAAAKAAVELPAGCGDPIATLRASGDIPSYDVAWVHLVGPDGDVVVQGDKILVRVNATTGKVHSVFKKWRSVPPTPPA
jgi:hypothetical protein